MVGMGDDEVVGEVVYFSEPKLLKSGGGRVDVLISFVSVDGRLKEQVEAPPGSLNVVISLIL